VNRIPPKHPRLRLERKLYEQLQKQVLSRDGWRCQCCGARTNLEVHHKQFRSQGGNDSEQNMITVCVECHASCHGWGGVWRTG
jgi:5-methylcytosine-specific restriction endonuclease McrA